MHVFDLYYVENIAIPDPGPLLNGKILIYLHETYIVCKYMALHSSVSHQKVLLIRIFIVEYTCNDTSTNCIFSSEFECDPPYVDEHASVRIRRDAEGVTATFECDDGYVLDGLETLQCVETGGIVYWDELEPSCLGGYGV